MIGSIGSIESGLGIARVGPTHPAGATAGATGYDRILLFFQASAVPKPSAATTRVRLKCLPGMEAAHAANLGWCCNFAINLLLYQVLQLCTNPVQHLLDIHDERSNILLLFHFGAGHLHHLG